MTFDSNLTKDEYITFYNKQNDPNILQSYEWGTFSAKEKNQKAVYVGIKDENGNILCASLLMKKSTPLHMCYYYAPRGFLIDYKNEELFKTFTIYLQDFLKKENAIYLKVDPDVIYEEVDNDSIPIKDGKNNYKLYDYMLKLGYKHMGFNKNYEHNQPRYSFKIDFSKSFDEIINNMSGTFLKNMKKSKRFNPSFEIGSEKDIKTFYNLYKGTAERDDFSSYNISYYENFYKTFKDSNMAEIFLININPKELNKDFNEEIARLNNSKKDISNENKLKEIDNSINKIKKEIEIISPYKNEEKHAVAAHIMLYNKNICTAFFAASDASLRFTNANNQLYYDKFKYSKDIRNITTLDLFGVTGDPNSKVKNLKGLYEFKKSMGATLYEYIGEFDLINKPFWYKVLPVLLKIYRSIKKI